MTSLEHRDPVRDLGNGLVLCRATAADTEQLVARHSDLHRDEGMEQPDERVGAWTRDLMERPHPTVRSGDFTVVKEVSTGRIVSSMCLISQTWSYGGIEFGVGRPELVGTEPEFRQKGLVRAQFELIHQWSAARGERLQAITGIPWYYRQFGYDMALNLSGGRVGYKPHLPKLDNGQAEPYRVRPATEADLPFVAAVYAEGNRRCLVACVRDEALWRDELAGKSEQNVNRVELRVIETAGGQPVGFLAHPFFLWGSMLATQVYELAAGVSWLAVTPSVARYLWQTGQEYARAAGKSDEFAAFGFWLGAEHPAYEALNRRLPDVRKPYAFYLRLPDVAGFVRHVAPVLERRLLDSAAAGHSAELKISFYRSGMRLVLEGGRLTEVEPWMPIGQNGVSAAFPDLTFLQLLFGYRSLQELDDAFADCYAATCEARALLEALFPKQMSRVWPIS